MMSYQELLRQLAHDRASSDAAGLGGSGSGSEEHLRELVYAQLCCDLPLLDFDGAARGVRAVARALHAHSPAHAVTPKVAENVAVLAAADGPARPALQALAVTVLRHVLHWATDPAARPSQSPAVSSLSSQGSPPCECSSSNGGGGDDGECEFEPFDDTDDSDPFGLCGDAADAAAGTAKDAALDDAVVLNALGRLCSTEVLGLPAALDTHDGAALAAELVAAVDVFAARAAANDSDADGDSAFSQDCLDTAVALVRDATCTARASAAAEQLLAQLAATLDAPQTAPAAPQPDDARTLALLSVLAQAARAGQTAAVAAHVPSVAALLAGPRPVGARTTAAAAELVTALADAGDARLVHRTQLDRAALAQCARQTCDPAARSHATAALLTAVLEGVCCRLRGACAELAAANAAFAPFRAHGGTVLARATFTWDLLRSLLAGGSGDEDEDEDAEGGAAVLGPLRELLAPAVVESERGALTECVLRDLVCVWQHWAPAPVLAPVLRDVLADALALCRRRAAPESETRLAVDVPGTTEQEQELREKWQARYARMQRMLLVVLHERKTD